MNEILFARLQMAMSLGFHIVFAAVGIAMPLMMAIADTVYLKTGNEHWKRLALQWGKGTAVFFAIGAVSGTVLSFELGLLFPKFMELSGPVIGPAFALEGIAFFTEAIFLGIYLYGRDKLKPGLHVASAYLVALSGVLSAVFVTSVNAWMNTPAGATFDIRENRFTDINTLAALTSPSAFHEIAHGTLATYVAVGLAVAAIHALGLLRRPHSLFHQSALKLSLLIALPGAFLQPLLGHFAGGVVARHQPLKLAAMEKLEHTQKAAPLKIAGIVEIPGLLSFLATGDFQAEMKGLDAFPREDWPHPITHFCFQTMIGIGTLLFFLALGGGLQLIRGRSLITPLWLKLFIALGPLGFIALEAGWIVTEVGRQPWVIYELLRTKDAVTPMPGLVVPLFTFSLLYLLLGLVTVGILKRYVSRTVQAA